VTTIFAKRVPRSLVSAITQTPASGPDGPVTVPPMSEPGELVYDDGDEITTER